MAQLYTRIMFWMATDHLLDGYRSAGTQYTINSYSSAGTCY